MRVYASFDAFPSPKGAATHIAAFARGLGRAFGPLELLTVEPGPSGPLHRQALGPAVRHTPLGAPGKTLIDRALAYRANIAAWWDASGIQGPAEWTHVRSIYEGYPLAQDKARLTRHLVYEVNGLPSIELKYHYPRVAEDRELLHKLRAQEAACLRAADLVVTPSAVTASHLLACGLEPARLRVIRNGVDLDLIGAAPPPPRVEALRVLYAGTLTAWQGVFVALDALRLYRRDLPATLTLVGPAKRRQRTRILERAHELGLGESLTLLPACSRAALVELHQRHDVVLAPLLPNDRNLIQGCSPLKVLEALAAGTPLVASDLPVVRELCTEEHALLVKAGQPKSLKDGLLEVWKDPQAAAERSRRGRAHVEAGFSWTRALDELVAAYREVLLV